VIADGAIEEVSEVKEKVRLLGLLAKKFPAYTTGAGHAAEVATIIQSGLETMAKAVRIFRVRLEHVTGKKKGATPPTA
jgi:hypothetical protein